MSGIQINTVQFIKSSPDVTDCPRSTYPEYAFVGRSNVGKSSLINYLTGHHKLAKTSNHPGRTQLINHFLINESWYLVDLPGYGYAKISKVQRAAFVKMIKMYLEKRATLSCLFLLIDSRRDPQKSDLEFIQWLGEKNIPFVICFTKIDKISTSSLQISVRKLEESLANFWESLPAIYKTSANTGKGRKEILEFITNTNKLFKTGSSK